MANPTGDNDVNNVGADNDTDELAHSDADSPGMAAKKARLRQAMADATAAKPRNRANVSGDFNSLKGIGKSVAHELKPAKLGAEVINNTQPDPMAGTTQEISNAASTEQSLKSKLRNDPEAMARFVARLKQR